MPLGMVIVRVIESSFVICQRQVQTKKKELEDKLECDVVAGQKGMLA